MMAAAIVGGYMGARTARRIDQRYIRGAITAVSIAITIAFFARS
jgi:uncharacterized membrane protein YfcA